MSGRTVPVCRVLDFTRNRYLTESEKMSLYTWKKPWLWLLAHGVDWKQAEGNPTQFLRELFCQRHCSFLRDKLISPGRSLLHRGLRHLWPSPVLLRNVPFCPGMLSWALELTWFISDSPACVEWRTGEGRCSAEDPQPQGGWSWAQSSHLRAPPPRAHNLWGQHDRKKGCL